MWEKLRRRYTRLFFIIGGVLFIVDQIGRIETVKELYAVGKTWFATRSDIHVTWPPHTLLAIGVIFVLLGLVSFFLPEPKQTPNPAPTTERHTPTNSAQPSTEAAPHIDLIFDLSKTDTTGWSVRDEKLKVVNTSNTVAYDVQIQPKESHLYKATFETIARVEKGHAVYAVMDLRQKPTRTYYKDFEALLRFELEDSSEDDNFNVRVPIAVRFHDAKKDVLYQTSHEIVYNAFWREAHVHLVQATTLVDATPPLPEAATLVNTPPGPNKLLVKRIMRGTEKLMAWEIVREGFPNRYFVEFAIRNLEPKSCVAADYKVANEQWHEWYKQWKQQPGGFGGASGDGLDGTLPW